MVTIRLSFGAREIIQQKKAKQNTMFSRGEICKEFYSILKRTCYMKFSESAY